MLHLTFDQEKNKICKQPKIGGFEYFGDSDVVNKFTLFLIDRAAKCLFFAVKMNN